MVTSPVGARCPDCARIGRPKIMDANAGDLGRAATATVVVGVVGGVGIAVVARLLYASPLASFLLALIIAVLFIGAGVPAGETIRRAANRSMDTRVRYLAALSVFLVYVVGIVAAQLLGVPNGLFVQLFVLIGLAMGMWTAMNRVRP